jgi:ethanolamine utilization protein EutA (predicted chaperonin)
MRERLRSALATYRRSVPAPVAAMEKADEQLAVVSALEKKMQRLRFEEKVARLARARRAL